MLEDSGKKVEAQAKSFGDGRKAMSPGKLEKLMTGNYVVYVTAHAEKEVTVGKITAISKAEANLVIHRHKPVPDNHFRLYWKPICVEGGLEVLGNGSMPSTESVFVKRVLFPIQLHDGVIAHAAARRLDLGGYRYH